MHFRIYNIKDYLIYPEFAFKLSCFEPFIWSGNSHRHQPTIWYQLKHVICIFGATTMISQTIALVISLFVPHTTTEAELYEDSESEVFEALAMIFYFACGFYKFWNIFWRRDDIGRVLEELGNLFPSVAKQKLQAEVNTSGGEKNDAAVCYRLAYYEHKSRIRMQRLTRYFMFAYFTFNIIPILRLFIDVISHQEVITYKSQTNAWYPWYNHNHHSSFVGFVFTYLIEASADFASIIFIMSGEFLFCFLNTQMQLHFDYLASSLSALDASSPNAVLHLKTLINYHNELLRLSKFINSIFNFTFALDLIITTFAISLMGLAMIMVRLGQALMFSIGVSSFLILGYIFCNNGEEIINVTEQLDAAIFYSNWYEGSTEYRRMIFFFITRTKTPCKYSAYGYMTLSMEAYMRILKLSYQLFTSFRAIE